MPFAIDFIGVPIDLLCVLSIWSGLQVLFLLCQKTINVKLFIAGFFRATVGSTPFLADAAFLFSRNLYLLLDAKYVCTFFVNSWTP